MGKLESRWARSRWRQLAGGSLVACTLLLGCASGGTKTTAASQASKAEPKPAKVAPVEITGLTLREVAPGVRLELAGTGPLIWTQYRDSSGHLVVELPNSTLAAGVKAPEAGVGLVDSVAVKEVDSGDRPLTRLTIATKGEAEHDLTSQGDHLLLTLTPVGQVAADLAVASEPLPANGQESTAAGATEPMAGEKTSEVAKAAPPTSPGMKPMPETASPPAPVGTPEEPYVAPTPSGVLATRLERVEVKPADGGSTVRIYGDGNFQYSTFQLSDPDRFVIDLHGVINTSKQGMIPANGGDLERVRVAQFKSQPEPVSRVVLDLATAAVPHIEPTGDGLSVAFGQTAMASAAAPSAAPAEPSMPAAETETAQTATTPSPTQAAPAPAEMAQAETKVAESPSPATPAEPSAQMPEKPTMTAEKPAMPPQNMEPSQPAAAGQAGQPSDVSLFEAMDVKDVVPSQAAGKSATAESFKGKDVTAGQKKYTGEPISLSLRDADIKEVLRTFARISGLNMVIQPNVSSSVTVELVKVPWDQALDEILKISGLGYEKEGNIIRIAPAAQLAQEADQEAKRRKAQAEAVPLKTVLKRISYSSAAEIAGILQGGEASILSQRGSVVVDARTNTLIIKELPEFMDTVLAVIDQIDVPEPQVMIESRIVETTKEYSRTLGINWGFNGVADPSHGNTTGLVFPNNATGDGGVQLLTGGANGFLDLTLGNVLNTFTLDARLQAAETQGLVNVLSAPKIATMNNVRASIQSGLQIPIQTVSNNTVTVQYVNATLELAVTPHVTADGTVLMTINVQKREPQLAFVVGGAANAPIATKEAQTQVIVRDGGTTVIGGIYKVTSDQGQDRVPGLANIPVLGHLFKNHRHNNQNEELLIFITPRVIKL